MTLSWYESANEALFKKVASGYVFRSPRPSIFARPRYYLVNESQKAGIAACLRRWRVFFMINLVVMVLAIASVVLWPATWIQSSKAVFLHLGASSLTVQIILLVLFLAPPYIYLIYSLRPLLAHAPRTNEQITMSEQLSKIAAIVSSKALTTGLVAAIGLMIVGVLMLLVAFLNGELARGVTFCAPLLIMGGLLSGYFLHIGRLKTKLNRVAA